MIRRALLLALVLLASWTPLAVPAPALGLGQSSALPAPAAATAPADAPPWLRFMPRVPASWALRDDPRDPLRKTLILDAPPGVPHKRILALFSGPSPAYSIALSTVADLFAVRDIPVSFTLINTNQETARGHAALAEATPERYDLLLAVGSPAAALVASAFRDGPIPVVTVCAKDPVLLGQTASYAGSGTSIAYTSLDVPVAVQLAYLTRLLPELRTIVVLYDAKNTSAIVTQVRPLQREAGQHGIQVLEVATVSPCARDDLRSGIANALAHARAADPDGRRALIWITGSTRVFNELATITEVAGTVPVLSAVPNVVLPGELSALLSIGVSFENNATLAGTYALRILTEGARPGELAVGVISPPDIALNMHQARAIGLKIPWDIFESAGTVYDAQGQPVRPAGGAPTPSALIPEACRVTASGPVQPAR